MRSLLALLLALLPAAAVAQVKQSGNVTPGHAVAWTTDGVIKDAGTPVSGALTGLGVTTSGPGFCQNSGPITGPYNQLCLSVTSTGGTLTFDSYQGASGGMQLLQNGGPVIIPLTAVAAGVGISFTGISPTTISLGNVPPSKLVGCDITVICTPTELGVNPAVMPGLNSANLPMSGSVFAPATFGMLLPDASKPWMIQAAATNPGVDNVGGVLMINKSTSYSGLAPGNVPALIVQNKIANGVTGNQTGILGVVYNSNTLNSQPAPGTSSAVATYGTGFCIVVSCSATWGGTIAGYDTSGQANPPHPLIGLEVDNYGHGTDTNAQRVGLLIAAGTPDGTGTANQVSHGIFFGAPGTGAGGGYFQNLIDGFTAQTQNGIVLANMVFSPAGGDAYDSPGFAVKDNGAIIGRSLQLNTPSGVNSDILLAASNTSGNVLAAAAPLTFTNGIVLNLITFSGFAFLSTNFSVDGSGNTIADSLQPRSGTIGTLPACNTGRYGQIRWVNDSAVSPTYLGNVGAGGGAIGALVVCSGGFWQFH